MTERIFRAKGQKDKQPYHYKGCGLKNVYLMSGYEIVREEGDEGIIIHNLDDLHKTIALYLVSEQKVLTGSEVRYLRTYMDLSQSNLGKLIGCDSQTIARYEKETTEIPSPTDRLLRMIVLGHIQGKVDVQEVVRNIEEMESGRANRQFRFASTKKGWKTA